jgi:hypothetical protein
MLLPREGQRLGDIKFLMRDTLITHNRLQLTQGCTGCMWTEPAQGKWETWWWQPYAAALRKVGVDLSATVAILL